MLPLHPLLALLGLAGASPAAHASPFDKADALADCLSKSGVPTDALGTDDWKLDVAPYNLRLNFTPVGIAVPTTPKHVQDAVACAAKLGVKANAKCGGHSYGSFGLGGEDGHLTIEMDRMNKVVLDNTTGIATIEGGSRLGHVAWELYNQGNRAFSHGTCPGVGVGGHALHGGYGVSSHTKGLAVDWMVGATVVLANSTIVNCSATENSDLFWALRGAGGSMGVVTQFRFNTFVVPQKLTFFVGAMQWPTQERALVGMQAVQDFAQSMPPELNMRLFIAPRFINIEGLYYGDSATLTATLAPLVKKINATMQLVQEGGWLDQLKHFGNGVTIDQTHPYNFHETFYSSSLYTNALNDTQLKSFVGYWFNVAKKNKRDWYVQIDLHGGSTSAVTELEVDATSYAHRDYLLMYLFYDRVDRNVAYPADGFATTQNFIRNITDGMGKSAWGQYINYPDPNMDQITAQTNYWGTHLPKLQAVKKAVDPGDVFNYPQGVLPA
ncbi:hypothetical protein B0T24DRAFT_414925 [Lasiosphaeria ovina]|uniref:FAD-binding PCMH-type domain-containing protein n=1 Tax=Lasiosphaeria ovina TaxID=92902 RepID=A0AAE0JXG1_9PEZI|nr:hypothetical protein B0T24DRAFT_414925 [Lasiosphaeria ovina]